MVAAQLGLIWLAPEFVQPFPEQAFSVLVWCSIALVIWITMAQKVCKLREEVSLKQPPRIIRIIFKWGFWKRILV